MRCRRGHVCRIGIVVAENRTSGGAGAGVHAGEAERETGEKWHEATTAKLP